MVRRVALEERAALALADLDPPDAARLLADAMEFFMPDVMHPHSPASLLARFDRLGEDT